MQAPKPLVMALAVSAALLTADAAAQSRQPPLGSAPMSSVQVTAPARTFRLYQDDLDAVRGIYAMSNGWRLQVSPAPGGISAQLGRGRAMRLVAVSPDKYASHDGNVTMEFNRGNSGDDMVMTYVPDPRLAQVVVVKATLAQR
ncbi:MAG: hypothetical protein ACRYF7_05005 [Janthinobacterium lividum]